MVGVPDRVLRRERLSWELFRLPITHSRHKVSQDVARF